SMLLQGPGDSRASHPAISVLLHQVRGQKSQAVLSRFHLHHLPHRFLPHHRLHHSLHYRNVGPRLFHPCCRLGHPNSRGFHLGQLHLHFPDVDQRHLCPSHLVASCDSGLVGASLT